MRDVTEGPTGFANVEHYRGLSISQAMCTVEHLAAIHASATALLIEGETHILFQIYNCKYIDGSSSVNRVNGSLVIPNK